MARILGLDLGAHTVKAVFVESAMRGHAVKRFTAIPRGEGERMETLKRALAELQAQGPLQVDQIVVALPGPALATHPVTLPFLEPKRIEATLPFEVEGQIPFDLQDVVFDYQVGQQKDKKSDLIVGVVRKEELRGLLTTLSEAGIEPRVVSHPALAYQNFFTSSPALFADAPVGGLVAIVDIGHERTGVCIGQPGVGVESARTFPGGGRELTRVLANELKLLPEEAEQLKQTRGAVGTAVDGPDGERLAAILNRGLQPILREVRATLKAHEARTRRTVSAVYLCGGTSALPGLEGRVSEELQLPVRSLLLPMETRESIAGDAQRIAAQPYALALRGLQTGAKAPRFNLRRGEFGFKGDFDYLRERMGRLGAFAATILLLLLATGFIRNSLLSRREEAVSAELCEVTKKVLGTCEKDFTRALSLLRGKESPAASIPRHSAVELLAHLVKAIPPDVSVEFSQVLVDLNRISVRVTTESPKMVDRINQAIKANPCFREVNQGKLERSSDQKRINFKMDIDVECPDNANAQANQG